MAPALVVHPPPGRGALAVAALAALLKVEGVTMAAAGPASAPGLELGPGGPRVPGMAAAAAHVCRVAASGSDPEAAATAASLLRLADPAEATEASGSEDAATQSAAAHPLHHLNHPFLYVPLTSPQVDAWLRLADALSPAALAAAASSHLVRRSYLVGHALSCADAAVWGALGGAGVPEGHKGDAGATAGALGRWTGMVAALMSDMMPAVADAVAAARLAARPPKGAGKKAAADKVGKGREGGVGGGDQEGKDKGRGKAATPAAGNPVGAGQGRFDVALPGDPQMGAVVTRFPPEPSGYLHVGHAKAAFLNAAVAAAWDGAMLVRFDDTNPDKERDEFVEAILSDIRTLGLTWKGEPSYTSDHFVALEMLVVDMAEAGLVYADSTAQARVRSFVDPSIHIYPSIHQPIPTSIHPSLLPSGRGQGPTHGEETQSCAEPRDCRGVGRGV